MGQRYSSVASEMSAIQVRKATKEARLRRGEERRQAWLRYDRQRQKTEEWAKDAARPIIEGIERQIESAAANGRYKIMWRAPTDVKYSDLERDCLKSAVVRHFRRLGFKITESDMGSFLQIKWK